MLHLPTVSHVQLEHVLLMKVAPAVILVHLIMHVLGAACHLCTVNRGPNMSLSITPGVTGRRRFTSPSASSLSVRIQC